MSNKEQLAILKQGVDKWNKWRKENPDIKINLSKSDLSYAILNNVDLKGANLSYSSLSYAKLNNADLREANLSWFDQKTLRH